MRISQSRNHRGHKDPQRGNHQDPEARPYIGEYDPSVCPFHPRVGPGFLTCILLSQLLASPQVLFAGYKVPHPLHPYFIVKIQTDGTITPAAVLEQACTKLIATVSSLEAKFKLEFSYHSTEGGKGADEGADPTANWTGPYMDF